MAKQRKAWMIRPAKKPKTIPDSLKKEVEAKAKDLIENVLKPKHLKPPQENERFNYIIDIGTKWYRSYFYFFSTYACPGPNALSPRSSRSSQGWNTSATASLPSISCAIRASGLGY